MNYEINFKLKEIITKKHMTQKKLSEISGVRESTISDLVRGTRTVVNLEHLTKLSRDLQLKSITDIINFKGK